MIREWGDLDARARGLSTRLLDRAGLLALARAPGLPALGRALPADRRPSTEVGDLTAHEIERAVRGHAARLLVLLARWADRRRPALSVVFEEEDLRSVRALLRGAAGFVPPERRLAGLIPTPTLPEPVLVDAARAESPQAVLERLASWGQRNAGLAAGAGGGIAPDLFRIEVQLARMFARRGTDAARKGGKGLRAYAAEVVDLENAWSALLAGGYGTQVPAADLFIEGGRALDRDRFLEAAGAGDPIGRRRLVARAFAGTALEPPFSDPATPSTKLEAAVLRARIEEQRIAGRVDPLGPAPLLEFALRLRAQVRDLQVVAWGVALAAPPDVMTAELVAR